jgi:hypothetical protein
MRSIQGEIERYHRSMKNLLLLDLYYLPQALEQRKWVEYYNHHQYHESLDNLTPADVLFGRKQERGQQGEKSNSLPSPKEGKVILASNSKTPESTPSLTPSGVLFYLTTFTIKILLV